MFLPGKGISWKTFFTDLKDGWNNDMLGDVAGSVTFFAVLALFPFLLFLVSLGSLFINPDDVSSLVSSLSKIAPQAVTQILGERLHALATQKSISLLTVSAITAIWSASGGMTSLMSALNTCYGVKEQRPFWKTRGLAITMTLIGAAMTLIATFAAVALPPIANAIGGPLGALLLWLRMPVAAVLVMLLWAVLYWALPDVEQDFKFITPGSVVGVILWAIASYGFSQYVSHFGNYEVTYGTLGGVIVLLFWMWISSITILLGAEINAVIEHRSPEGKRVGAKRLADSGADVSKPEKEKQEEQARRRPVVKPVPMPIGQVVAHRTKQAAGLFALSALFRSLRRRPT